MKKAVCVIGGGLAGGILGSVLAAKGHPVTLVELGESPGPLLPGNELWTSAQIKAPFTRGSGIGGTSNFWHGGLTPLDRTDVEGAAGQSGRPRTPIPYDQLRAYYAKAVALLRDGKHYSLDDLEAPLDTPLDGFGNSQEAFRLKALLYPSQPFSTRPLIERSQALHGLQVVTNVEVMRLASSGGRRFAYAEGVDVRSGEPRRIPADIFVLSAGGLGSAKILLRSAADRPSLRQLPIGKFMTDHPTGFVLKAKLRRRMDLRPLFGLPREGYKLRYGFALQADRLASVDFRNHILYLRPAVSLKDPATYDILKRKLVSYRGRKLGALEIAYLIRHPDLLFEALNFKFGLTYATHYVSGLVFAEQLPQEDASIALLDKGKFAVNWSVSQRDAGSLEKFLSLFREAFHDLFAAFTIFPGISTRLDSAAHHSGACRMAASATEGVVDGDLRVFGTDNLFVADGSVIAYAGHANTGLTIAALALKCSDAVQDA